MTNEERQARRQARTAQYTDLLERASKAGSIYNADYTNIKDWFKNRFEEDLDTAKWEWWHSLTYEQRESDKLCNELLYKHPSITQLAGYRKFLAKLDANEVANIVAVLDKWQAISDMLIELKDKTIKGRKPSENPRPVNQHDFDKRTCPCCFGRFQLTKEGRMVRHGWQQHYGWQTGECFGWGRKSYEESPEGTREFREYLEECNEEGKYDKEIKFLQKMEEAWKPQK